MPQRLAMRPIQSKLSRCGDDSDGLRIAARGIAGTIGCLMPGGRDAGSTWVYNIPVAVIAWHIGR